jgi:hypothetical protein
MRKFVLLGLLSLLLCSSCNAKPPLARPDNVLFIGNSLTYVGNLPAVSAALARANGHSVRSYLVVGPGATLSEREEDGSVPRALRQCDCTILILQERGGDLFGSFGPEALTQSNQAVMGLARAGQERGADHECCPLGNV